MADPAEPRAAARGPRDPLLENATWKPPHWELADVTAVRAVAEGRATPEQQKRAMAYVVNALCGINDWPYRPGANDRDTNIGLGRQFVGHMISKMCRLDLSKVRRSDK